jgi:hypothetical protein
MPGAARNALGLSQALQVGGDGALRPVGGSEVPLEGAEKRAQGGAVHAQTMAQ